VCRYKCCYNIEVYDLANSIVWVSRNLHGAVLVYVFGVNFVNRNGTDTVASAPWFMFSQFDVIDQILNLVNFLFVRSGSSYS